MMVAQGFVLRVVAVIGNPSSTSCSPTIIAIYGVRYHQISEPEEVMTPTLITSIVIAPLHQKIIQMDATHLKQHQNTALNRYRKIGVLVCTTQRNSASLGF